jgi:hypothetical protein
MKRLLFILLAFVAINSFGQTKKFNKITTKFLNVKYPITTDSDGTSANWYTAFNWGDHSTQGYLTNYVETDPNVSAWAKAASKPTYTYSEVGAAAANHGDHGLATHALSSTAHPRDTRNQLAGSYLSSFTETDPNVPAHVKSITTAEKDKWNTAYNPTNSNKSDVDWAAKDIVASGAINTTGINKFFDTNYSNQRVTIYNGAIYNGVESGSNGSLYMNQARSTYFGASDDLFLRGSLRLYATPEAETIGYYISLRSNHASESGELRFSGAGGAGWAIGGLDYGANTGLYANSNLVAKLYGSTALVAFQGPVTMPEYLTVTGSVTALDVSTTGSDIRLKHDIKSIENLESYDQIHFRQFYMNKDSLNKRRRVGVVADSVLKTHPEFVLILQDSMKTKTVNYEGLLCAKIARLEQRLDELEECSVPDDRYLSFVIVICVTLLLMFLIRRYKW